jgi:NAD(P)-dependent dehydrogenase (short-subunit alcohol dehydrogenase family)
MSAMMWGTVSDWSGCDQLVETVYAEFGRVDVLVDNAGLSPPYLRRAQVALRRGN